METGQLKVWSIDDEYLIVAHSERDMRAVYREYHGESIRGHERKLLSPNDSITLEDDGGDTTTVTAAEFATLRGFFPAR